MARIDIPLSPDGVERELADGGRIALRPIRPEDAVHLREGFRRMSDRSRYMRFFTPLKDLPRSWAEHLSDIDHVTHRAWVAYDPGVPTPDAPGLGVGVARLIQLPDDPTSAEAAIAIADDYHGRGIGTLLLEVIAGTAQVAGYRSIVTNVLPENTAMRALVERLGDEVRTTRDGQALRIEVFLDPDDGDDDRVIHGALYSLLRHAAADQP